MSLEIYGQVTTFICINGFEIPYGFKLILKIVWRTTGGSVRIFVIFSKPLIGIRQTIRRSKDIIEAHLFHIYYFL